MPAPDPTTRTRILDGAIEVLQREGVGDLSIRKVAAAAAVPLSQVHYHFGSRRGLLLAVLFHENQRLIARQRAMYGTDTPLWKQWHQACDFYDDDLESGYVRVLQEMMAAGWSDPAVAVAVRSLLAEWHGLLCRVAQRAEAMYGGFGPLDATDVATLVTAGWLGVEAMQLLGFEDAGMDLRPALRKVGEVLRSIEQDRGDGGGEAAGDVERRSRSRSPL
jgi:AcrR family transcriptional regulator